jgi:hypothetical protein
MNDEDGPGRRRGRCSRFPTRRRLGLAPPIALGAQPELAGHDSESARQMGGVRDLRAVSHAELKAEDERHGSSARNAAERACTALFAVQGRGRSRGHAAARRRRQRLPDDQGAGGQRRGRTGAAWLADILTPPT